MYMYYMYIQITKKTTISLLQAELAQHSEQVKQLHSEVEGQVSELSSAVEEGGAKRAELQQSLQRYEKECNHWKQKSVQQDMVLQTARGVLSIICHNVMYIYMYMYM